MLGVKGGNVIDPPLLTNSPQGLMLTETTAQW